jgi:L-lactate permease
MQANLGHKSADIAAAASAAGAAGAATTGVGGFNTPIALGAPMLASLGHDPLTSLLVVVVFNTLASHMGSMGMAVWFGFKILGELGVRRTSNRGRCAAVLF